MIPKIIHYIWFGNQLEPFDVINNWQIMLPEYEIRRWSEIDFKFDQYGFAKKAYEFGKFGMAIDLFRAEILAEHGGIWLDTDVVIHKNFSSYLNYSFFIGHEKDAKFSVSLIGVTPHHPFLISIVEWYKTNWKKCGDVSAQSMEYALRSSFTGPLVFTRLFTKEYDIIPDGTSKILYTKDGMICLEAPPVFTIKIDNYGLENYAEHLYTSSWRGEKSSFYNEIVKWYDAKIHIV